jgi:hypothetical protein
VRWEGSPPLGLFKFDISLCCRAIVELVGKLSVIEGFFSLIGVEASRYFPKILLLAESCVLWASSQGKEKHDSLIKSQNFESWNAVDQCNNDK